jgi:hypothetical protein
MNPTISASIIRRAGVLIAAAIVAAAPLGVAPAGASAAACAAWTGVQPPNPGTSFNELSGVAVLSPCNAWAVGAYSNGAAGQTLIVHWNGAAWKQVASPSPATGSFLTGVAAISATNIWAVGHYFTGGRPPHTLIVHWNGAVWKQVASPNPSSAGNFLTGVAATSARNAWAVGYYLTGFGPRRPVILHWNGAAWRRVKRPKYLDAITGVAATSARNAWAVGVLNADVGSQTLILHWNGTAWRRVKSPNPNPRGDSSLEGVAATSTRNAWAVGSSLNGTTGKTLILHWNGTAWRLAASPNPSSTGNALTGVAAASARNAWAVGAYDSGTGPQTFALHCC